MAEPTAAAPETGTAAPAESINTLTDAWKAAQKEAAPPVPPEAAPEGTAESTANEPAEVEQTTGEPAAPPIDPDHVNWAKRVQGNWDAEKGQWNIDLLTKRAFELNRQNQLQAQSIAKIEALLAKPEVLAAIQAAQGIQPPQPREVPKEPQTDQEILADFIQKEVQKSLGPKLTELEQNAQFASQRQVMAELNRVRDVLTAEFGKIGETPAFQTVAPQILSDFEAVAREQGIAPDAMISQLARSGRLETTIRSMAKSLLFDRMQEQLAAEKKRSVTVKKGLQQVPKGASQAKPAGSEPGSIAEAFRLAKEQASAANRG